MTSKYVLRYLGYRWDIHVTIVTVPEMIVLYDISSHSRASYFICDTLLELQCVCETSLSSSVIVITTDAMTFISTG
ncbi:hypothetical protein TNCT_400871 [Trichonephila clavata]|uniref:Uncharacterized protein n=1 Tax=Trichonephila clavata TaxID=2740835 RepID=A0A8X6KYA8_TRICU|nr:hypothetical protein TNCT_400871 [Trichonephila clavata]